MTEMETKKKEVLQKAMRLCSRSEKSAKDIREKLYQWQAPSDSYDEIIAELYDKKFLDDKRYAESFVNDKIYLSKWGKQKVQFALKCKEISENTIEDAFEIIDEERYQEGLQQLLSTKKKSVKANSDYEKIAKLMRFGQSRGFTMEEINNALNKIL